MSLLDDFTAVDFSELTPSGIEGMVITAYEEASGQTVYPGDPVRLFLQSHAYLIRLLAAFINETGNPQYLAHARGPHQDRLGALVDTARLPASPSRTVLRFSTAETLGWPVLIPQGTRANAGDGDTGLTFATDETAIIPAGERSVDVAATCLRAGAHANGLVPGQILAPGFSDDPAVAVVIGAKAANINGHFKATGLVDVPSSVAKYTDVPAWVKDNNLTDPALQIFFGSPVFGNAVEHGSVHLAATVASRDADNEGVPYWSPSNRRMLCNGLTHAGRELALTPSEAAYLNGQGIVTGLNFTGQMTVWGNRTAAYPAVTDVKDTFIPVRRMFNYIGNTLVLTAWQFTDSPLRRRFIEQICDSFNLWLNGLAAREYILGGKVAFLAGENPSTDLIDGTARFHVFIAPPPPAREIRFTLEYDPSYLTNLFAE